MSIRTLNKLIVASLTLGLPAMAGAGQEAAQRYIVQARDAGRAQVAVLRAGGAVVAELEVINAVGAELSAAQVRALRAQGGLRLYADVAVKVARARRKTNDPATSTTTDTTTTTTTTDTTTTTTTSDTTTTEFQRTTSSDGLLSLEEAQRSFLSFTSYTHPLLVGAPEVHGTGINGKGVTVAVVDTGLWWEADTLLSKAPKFRFDTTNAPQADDPNGHGTHVSSIIGSNRLAANMVAEGIAPAAQIGAVRAFHYDGSSTYIDAIEAIDYVVNNRTTHNIRVLNLSFSATPQSYYWDDPLNQAVMKAWQAGIVVVAAAGNDGPNPMTIGVPGNVPYIITVGAMSDSDTPADGADDRLASFSSTGPTYEGFVKPEVVAPGGHITGSMPFDGWIPLQHPDSMLDTERQFKMSGTSQATAIVSGIVALMLQKDPTLTPDTVKCRLMAAAKRSVDSQGAPAYTVFQQGAGLVNAPAALASTASGCANQGLDITKDLKGTAHFEGPANVDEAGNFFLQDATGTPLTDQGLTWNGAYAWDGGYAWTDGKLWSRTDLWSSGRLWSRGKLWSKSVSWVEGQTYTSGTTGIRSITRWVGHE
jgi:serine protease AprX